MQISASLIEATRSEKTTLYTLELVYPKFIHPEVLTHRVFSRNSASSRAIPFLKMVDSVMNNPAVPEFWPVHHRGMSAPRNIQNKNIINLLGIHWLQARDAAVKYAKTVYNEGASKQVANRLLEPFAHIKVLVTFSREGYKQFVDLRAFGDGVEPHMQKLAMAIVDAVESAPSISKKKYHIPYSEDLTVEAMQPLYLKYKEELLTRFNESELHGRILLKMLVSAARCARISYTVFGQAKKDRALEEDVELAFKLFDSKHSSPFEHVAMVYPNSRLKESRNFGENADFYQFRAFLENGGFDGDKTPLQLLSNYLNESDKEWESVLLFKNDYDHWDLKTFTNKLPLEIIRSSKKVISIGYLEIELLLDHKGDENYLQNYINNLD